VFDFIDVDPLNGTRSGRAFSSTAKRLSWYRTRVQGSAERGRKLHIEPSIAQMRKVASKRR